MPPSRSSARLYRTLLFCYPAEFRHEYGRQMVDLFGSRIQRENPFLLWMELLADIAFTAPKEHYHVFVQDLRYALRAFAKTPGFALTAVLTLALGTGATTAIFSVVNAVVLQPLPFPQPERLVRIWETNPKQNIPFFSASVPNFVSWQQQAKRFESLGAYGGANLNITGAGEPERLAAGSLTASMFQVIGVRPILGRGFSPEEQLPGRARVAVLGEKLWHRRFASDPHIVGRQIELNGLPVQVVGVLPAAFGFPQNADIWVPITIDAAHENRADKRLTTVGRLKPGITLAQADAELKSIAGGLESMFPQTNKAWTTRTALFFDWLVPEQTRRALVILLGAVGLVLLIACANVANLLLARAAGRNREIAMRVTLGAGRSRLMRQLLTESIVLALAGGVAGSLLAFWAVSALKQILPPSVPRRADITVDGTVLAFALLISLVTGLLFGLAPLWQAARRDLIESLKEGGRSSTAGSSILRNALVVIEVAMGMVLVIGASLLVRSFLNMHQVRLGFQPDRLLTAQISLPKRKYPTPAALAFYHDLLERLRSSPGVSGAAISSGIPFGAGDYTSLSARAARDTPPSPAEMFSADWRMVSADYFKTLRIPLLRGRTFTNQDANGGAIIMVSANMGRHLWGDADPVGKELQFQNQVRYRVVGVVGDVRQFDLSTDPTAAMYFPAPPSLWDTMTVVIRTTGDPERAANLLRQSVKQLDPNQPLFNVQTMDQLLQRSAAEPRAYTLLLAIFAQLALVLACVGIYGVLSYSVARRTPEIGVRMALGASRANVLMLVVREGMLLVAAGLVVGIAGALGLIRLIQSMLYGVSPRDPLTFGGVSAALLIIALAACLMPAMRASRVDPVVALRVD